MVFQHFSLFETLTVAENIALALDERTSPAALADRIRSVSESYGLPVDPHRLVHSMSVGERQRVEIVRCLLQSPRLLIMDEPTSVLTPQAVVTLFDTLRRLAAEHVSILYISHKLDEVRALCDSATVLRGGARQRNCHSERRNEPKPGANDGRRRTARVPAHTTDTGRRATSAARIGVASRRSVRHQFERRNPRRPRGRNRRDRRRIRQRPARITRRDLRRNPHGARRRFEFAANRSARRSRANGAGWA